MAPAYGSEYYLELLINTWIYTDIIARFTTGDICSQSVHSLSDESIS
jgi:hypothetical protein